MKTFDQILQLFQSANEAFLHDGIGLIKDHVSERTLCGELKDHIRDLIRDDPSYQGYYVDVEYNRNRASVEKNYKTILGPRRKVIRINCDLILHSRGWNVEQDNLLALEMKKYDTTSRYASNRQHDRERLIAMTKDTYSEEWDGVGLPKHVCRYVLGVFYEIDYLHRVINLEYYQHGRLYDTDHIDF